jgi:carbon starvation protein
MNSAIIAITMAVLYVIAYKTYGKFLAKKIFKLNENNKTPSVELQDNVDFVPTKKDVLFGHHFASIAGTGPIVGPAIAIIWGWLPALIWVLFGSILMGAMHDFGALIISMRNQGHTIGELSGEIINKRVKILFLLIIFFLLLIVVAIFGVVIGVCFDIFPSSVIPVWFQIPIAITLGWLIYKKGFPALPLTIAAVILMYLTVVLGAYFPLEEMPTLKAVTSSGATLLEVQPIAIWVILLLIYAYIASILPVQTLLQPRDYINAYQLFVAMGLLGLGILVSHPVMVAPATQLDLKGAPPVFPMLFVIIACGAISGFHSLVSSGTSSKQCDNEKNALFIGYGSMLTEGMLATFVIIACGAGIGLGYIDHGIKYTGTEAFAKHYGSWATASSGGLPGKLHSFVVGAQNMIASLGIAPKVALTIMGVFIVSFAATTLDTATRIQRYIVSEIATIFKMPFLAKKHPSTMIAVFTAFVLAFYNTQWAGKVVISGKGAFTLWPLFGCTNQLLAGLSLLVITVYLARTKRPIYLSLLPMIFMIAMTAYALILQLKRFYSTDNMLLLIIGSIVLILQLWMVLESVVVLHKVYFNRKQEIA